MEIAQLLTTLGIETMSNHRIHLLRCRGHNCLPQYVFRRASSPAYPKLETHPNGVCNPTKVAVSIWSKVSKGPRQVSRIDFTPATEMRLTFSTRLSPQR